MKITGLVNKPFLHVDRYLVTPSLTAFWLNGYITVDTNNERGNLLLSLHERLFPNSSKGYFTCTITETGQHIPRHGLHQLWSTGGNKNSSIGPPAGIDPTLHRTMSYSWATLGKIILNTNLTSTFDPFISIVYLFIFSNPLVPMIRQFIRLLPK